MIHTPFMHMLHVAALCEALVNPGGMLWTPPRDLSRLAVEHGMQAVEMIDLDILEHFT